MDAASAVKVHTFNNIVSRCTSVVGALGNGQKREVQKTAVNSGN